MKLCGVGPTLAHELRHTQQGHTMNNRFQQCLAETLALEGGYSNDPHDPGGPTQSGITQRVYDAYRSNKGLPRRHVSTLQPAERDEIYWLNYWLPSHAGTLPPGLDLAVWDFAVNSGPGRAIKVLQRVLGVTADGHFGQLTEAAARRSDLPRLIAAYVEARREFLRALPTFWRFGNGWMARCARIEAGALEAAGELAWAAQARVAADPLPADVDQRSAEQGRAIPAEPRPPVMAEIGAAGSGATSFGFALPNIIQRGFPGGKFSPVAFAVAVAGEPLFWAAMVMLWGALAMWLWRRKMARAVT